MAFDFLASELRRREQSSLRRVRLPLVSNKDGIIEINGRHYIQFASNDYLGLSQHEKVLQSYVEGLAVYGSGSGASSLVTGYSAEHKALEDDLCEVLNKPAAMLFTSGFAANQAICHALFHNGPREKSTSATTTSGGQIIADKYMHASFIQGAIDTGAHMLRFKHNDMHHAANLIAKAGPDSLLATEGIFSMDGDAGNIAELQRIIKKSHANNAVRPWLMVDDAHAIGVLGKNGFGSADCEHIDSSKIDIIMGTFGKALGSSGAFVAGSAELIEYMVNLSKHYVYSTAISPAQARAIRTALALVEQGVERDKLHQNIAYFSEQAKQKGLPILESKSAIQAIVIGDPVNTLNCSEKLADLGLWVPAIRTPTVPKNTDRLRITLSAVHSTKDIDALLDGLCLCVLPLLKNTASKAAEQ